MLNHPAASEILCILRAAEYDETQRKVAAGLTLENIQIEQPDGLDPDGRESLERTAARITGLRKCPECSLSWAKRFSAEVQDKAARQLLERFANLIEECVEQLKIRPQDKVMASKVLDVAKGFSWFEGCTRQKPHAGAAPASIAVSHAAMVAKYLVVWPTIRRDFKDASDNGLSAAARAGARKWWETKCIAWAEANNKLIKHSESRTVLSSSMNLMANLPSRKHVLNR